MSFYPTPEDPRHRKLKQQIEEICNQLSIRCMDMVRYYADMPDQDRRFIQCDFSHEGLWIRTLPDLYICPTQPPYFFLDVKSKANPKYSNISIELSSFYWTFRRNMPDSRGIKCAHFYVSYDTEGEIRVFSPLLVRISRVIIPLFHWFKGNRVPWTEEEKVLFRHYAICIVKNHNAIQEKDIHAGSGDPFVLIPQRTLKNHMEIHNFLQNHKVREEYIRTKGSATTDLGRFL